MTRLGPVVSIQVQRSALKQDGIGYDPAPLLRVEEAAIGPHGLIGFHDGGWVLDVHGDLHPKARGGGRRALSIGFTSHYDLMEQRFGGVPVGIAGENLVVASGRRILTGDLAGGLVVETTRGPIEFPAARPAAPCREFTSYLVGRDDVAPRGEIAADLEFLEGGMRGFLLPVDHLRGWHRLRVGDEVWARPPTP
jgi:hypothetical protein